MIEPTWKSNCGRARLWLADSANVMPATRKVDVVLTDPPYGIGLKNGDVDGHRSARSFVIKGDGDSTAGQSVLDLCASRGWATIAFASPWNPWRGKWRNLIVWDKGGGVGGGGNVSTCLKRSWELIQVARNGRLQVGRPESVVRFTMGPSDTSEHIAAKPVALIEWLLNIFTTENQIIFDPFMGSGTTGVAAINLGRRFLGVEIEKKHFRTAKRRIIQALSCDNFLSGKTTTADLQAEMF